MSCPKVGIEPRTSQFGLQATMLPFANLCTETIQRHVINIGNENGSVITYSFDMGNCFYSCSLLSLKGMIICLFLLFVLYF